jgi:hypothetical protein
MPKWMPKWFFSVRSLLALGIGYTLCRLALMDKLPAKDFLLIASLVFNFYYLNKQRKDVETGGEQK